jgi:hypothetical protein
MRLRGNELERAVYTAKNRFNARRSRAVPRHVRIKRPQFVLLAADHDVIIRGNQRLSDCTRMPMDLSFEHTAIVVQLSAAFHRIRAALFGNTYHRLWCARRNLGK